MFAKVDTDSSAGVDQTELSTMLSDTTSKTGNSLGDSKQLFSKMDSNSDGSLSSDELGLGMKDLPPPPSTMDFAQSRGATGSNGSQDDLFAKVNTDSDGSGSLSQAEFDAAKPQPPEGAQGGNGTQGALGPGGPGGPPPRRRRQNRVQQQHHLRQRGYQPGRHRL